MRWDALFNDLESQYLESDRLALETEINERSRAEAVDVELQDRLRGSLGCRLTVYLACGEVLHGALSHAGADALVLDEERYQILVPYSGATRYVGLARHSFKEASSVRRGIGLARALRGMGRDRAELAITVGNSAGAVRMDGVIDRVGRDYVDLAVLTAGESRRNQEVKQVATIPFAALAAIRSRRAYEL